MIKIEKLLKIKKNSICRGTARRRLKTKSSSQGQTSNLAKIASYAFNFILRYVGAPWSINRPSETETKLSSRLLLAMVNKHYGAGSTRPPLTPGLSRIYSMEYCPYAQRARLVALAKNLPHDVININLKSKPGWFLEMYPEGKIPVLHHNEKIIGDSIAICDYLEAQIPEPVLARVGYRECDRKLRKDWGRIVGLTTRITFGDNLRSEGGVAEVVGKLHRYLEPFEQALRHRNTVYFNGDYPGLMDYIMWPHVERFGVIHMMERPFRFRSRSHGDPNPDPDPNPDSLPPLPDRSRLPLLERWVAHMSQRDEVRRTRHALEKHYKMVRMYKSGDVDYDSL